MKKRSMLIVLFCSAIILFVGCGRTDIEELKETGDIKGLIRALRYDYNDEIREEAYDALLEFGPLAVEPLIDAIDDRNEHVRMGAHSLLREIGDSRAVEPLIDALEKDESNYSILLSLSTFGDLRAIEIFQKLRDSGDNKVTVEAGLIKINVSYVQPVISGQGINADPYLQEEPGIHPVVIANKRPFQEFCADTSLEFSDYDDLLDDMPLDWQALGEPESIQLVLCWGELEQITIETARYGMQDPVYGTLVQEKQTVILREAATGEIVATDVLEGDKTKGLPVSISAKESEDFTITHGVTSEILVEWLKKYVEV